MTELTFKKGERLSADKMNRLASEAAAGSSNYGGVRSRDGVTPLSARDRNLKLYERLWEAVSDASWDDSVANDEHWVVTAQRVNRDGTLDTASQKSFRAVGPETIPTPIVDGDRCIELYTADLRVVLVAIAYDQTDLPLLPYDLRVANSRIEIYVPKGDTLPEEESPGSIAGMLYINGEPVTAYDATTLGAIAGEKWWNVGGTLPTSGNVIEIWAYLKIQADLGTGTSDLTSAATVMLAFSQTGSAPSVYDWQKAWLVGIVSNTDDVYTVSQYYHGARNIDPRFTDDESSTQLGVDDIHKTQSISTQSANGEHSLTLYGFKTGASISPAPANLTGLKLLVRKVVSGVTKLLYLDGPDLSSIIETIAEGVTPTTPGGFTTGTSADNRRHYNLSSLTDKDDHCGNRTAVSGTTTKGLYIHPDGDETRNAMAGYIGDAFSKRVISPSLKTLYDGESTTKESIKWAARQALEPDGTTVSLDWNNQSAAIADVPNGGSATAADNATAINSILAALRAYKIIAT